MRCHIFRTRCRCGRPCRRPSVCHVRRAIQPGFHRQFLRASGALSCSWNRQSSCLSSSAARLANTECTSIFAKRNVIDRGIGVNAKHNVHRVLENSPSNQRCEQKQSEGHRHHRDHATFRANASSGDPVWSLEAPAAYKGGGRVAAIVYSEDKALQKIPAHMECDREPDRTQPLYGITYSSGGRRHRKPVPRNSQRADQRPFLVRKLDPLA